VTQYVAFLGGVNVGGHRVSMERLRAEMRSIGLDDARTFIASGNVIFTSRAVATTLEARIERHLEEQLGYAVPTFVRTARAVTSAAARDPFGDLPATDSHYVLFLRRTPTAGERRGTVALANPQDAFEFHGRELHWLVHGKSMDSAVKPAALARALRQPSTNRNVTSLRKLVAAL
jgi:uncharacterized protein (DUF1697 family)